MLLFFLVFTKETAIYLLLFIYLFLIIANWKNHEIWNVNSNMLFLSFMQKNSIFWFQEKQVFWDLKVKESMFVVELKCIFNKNETESKMEKNPTYTFWETDWCFSSYRNCELKVIMIWSTRKKKECFFVTFSPRETFLTFVFYILNKLSKNISFQGSMSPC